MKLRVNSNTKIRYGIYTEPNGIPLPVTILGNAVDGFYKARNSTNPIPKETMWFAVYTPVSMIEINKAKHDDLVLVYNI